MTIPRMTDHAGEWLRGAGPQSEIVISSRVRLARNLAGYPFINRADPPQQIEDVKEDGVDCLGKFGCHGFVGTANRANSNANCFPPAATTSLRFP